MLSSSPGQIRRCRWLACASRVIWRKSAAKIFAFSESEASQLLQDSVDLPLQSDVVEKIDRLTEGWPVGLKLAAISLQQNRNPEAVISQLSEQLDHVFADYLFAELLRHLDPPMQVLLARTAIFERLSAPLVELVQPPDIRWRQAPKSSVTCGAPVISCRHWISMGLGIDTITWFANFCCINWR